MCVVCVSLTTSGNFGTLELEICTKQEHGVCIGFDEAIFLKEGPVSKQIASQFSKKHYNCCIQRSNKSLLDRPLSVQRLNSTKGNKILTMVLEAVM